MPCHCMHLVARAGLALAALLVPVLYGQTVPTCNGLPATIVATVPGQILGTNGDDVIVGTAGADQISGGLGKDTICGGGGNDQISGGDGDDHLLGQAGNDTFTWNPGDDNDRIEGGSETDTLQFNGANVGETFDLSANGNRLRLTRNIANIVLDVGEVERVNLDARGESDLIAVNPLAGTGVQQVTLNLETFPGSNTPDGRADSIFIFGTPNDDQISITGTGNKLNITGAGLSIEVRNPEGALDTLSIQSVAGNDRIDAKSLIAGLVKLTVEGGPGDDTITGSQDADALVGGEGNDTFVWPLASPGDLVGGEAGTDVVQVLGSPVADNTAFFVTPFGINAAASGATTALQADVEEATFQAGRGADQIFIGTLAGTTLQKITLDLRATATGTTGDFYADAVTVNGSNEADNVSITGSAGTLTLTGLAPTIVVQSSESVRDTLTLNTGLGADVLNAQGLGADVIRLAVRGGDGDDILTGSPGDDVFMWSPGDDNDVIEGELGNDTLQFAGANVGETVSLSANGSRLRFTRDIASVVLDVNAVERVNFSASGGADTISLTDLSATGVKQVAIDLSALGNPAGDAQPDTIQISGVTTSSISTALGAGTINVTWSPVKISVTGVERMSDRLVFQTTLDTPAPAVISSAGELAITGAAEDDGEVPRR